MRPSPNFTISNASATTGWNVTTNENSVVFDGSSLNPGATFNALVSAVIANAEAPAASWIVEISDDPGGANPARCSGPLTTTISNNSLPIISNIDVANISASAVTITWATDEPATSQVRYGSTASYGSSTSLNSNLTTSHSVKITGLSANTAYHYQVVSRDGAGNEAVSGDNTFLTALVDPVPSEPSESQPLNTKIPLKTIPTEFVPPTIKLNTSFAQPFKQPPEVSGEATDNDTLAGIEYSTDGGQNWLPVDEASGLGTKKSAFSFTPAHLQDGNYLLIARAIDTSANIGKTAPVTLIIDQLPPLAGGNMLSIGPQILEPGETGVIETLAGIDQKITLSAVGGPTSITLLAKKSDSATQTFSLTKSTETGLWSGILSFEDSGAYSLIAEAVDGAGNKTERAINNVYLSEPAKTVKEGSKEGVKTNVSVYYLEQDGNSWVLWDGASFGQKNPQPTDNEGNFGLLLPAGKYYLKASARGYHDMTSTIFEVNRSLPVSARLSMKPSSGLHWGPFNLSWPDFSAEKIDLNVAGSKLPDNLASNVLAGKNVPAFSLLSTAGKSINQVSLLGRPTIITTTSTWSPLTSEQLPALNELQANKNFNVWPIAVQENSSKVEIYNQLSGYGLDWLSDPAGSVVGSFNVQSLPTHYFLDRKGVIKKIVNGVLSKQELTSHLLQAQ